MSSHITALAGSRIDRLDCDGRSSVLRLNVASERCCCDPLHVFVCVCRLKVFLDTVEQVRYLIFGPIPLVLFDLLV